MKRLLLVGIAMVFGVVGVTAFAPTPSAEAAPNITSSYDCWAKLGRTWRNNACAKVCDNRVAKPGYLIVSSPYDYCSNAASKISARVCAQKARVYQYGVCLKQWARQQGDANITIACANKSWRYVVANPYDYCRPR